MDFGQPMDFGSTQPDPKRVNIIGVGFETKRDGTYLRSAVEMRRNPSVPELAEAFGLLLKAYTDPESADVKVVRGEIELAPNVMQTSALIVLNEAESK